MRRSYSSLAHGCGSGTRHSGRPAASACAWSSSSRTPCMATREKFSLIVVTNPTMSYSFFWRSTCSVQALSLPLDQESRSLGLFIAGLPAHDAGSTTPDDRSPSRPPACGHRGWSNPRKLKPRDFKSFDSASDSRVRAGSCFKERRRFTRGRPPTKRHTYRSNEPNSFCTARNARALLIAAAIFRRLRTMPAFWSNRRTSRAPKRATRTALKFANALR